MLSARRAVAPRRVGSRPAVAAAAGAHLHRCARLSRSAALPARPCRELFQMCRRVVMRREHAPAGQGDSLKVRGRPYTDPRAVADLTFLVPADHKTIILYR